MICSFLLLDRLHSRWRRRLTILPLLCALAPARLGAAQPAAAPGAQTAIPSISGLPASQVQADFAQYQALQAQLLEERRQALVSASKQTDPAARLKIMADLLSSQAQRRGQLRQLHAEVLPLQLQTQAAARAAKPTAGR